MTTATVALPSQVVGSRWGARLILLGLVVALLAAITWRTTGMTERKQSAVVPQSSAMEAKLGVRFTHVAVVAGGGIIEVRYVVLDAAKASTFQSDTAHPPKLRDEQDGGVASQTEQMRQGHELRPGQTYYLMYSDPRGAIRPGDTVTIEDTSGLRLSGVPVI